MVAKAFKGQICIVTSKAFPESEGIEEIFVSEVERQLAVLKLAYTVVSSSSLPPLPHLEPIRIPMVSIPVLNKELFSFFWSILAAMRVLMLNVERRVRIIISVDTGYSALAAVFAGCLLRIPVFVHSSGTREDFPTRSDSMGRGAWMRFAIAQGLDHLSILCADKGVVENESSREYFSRMGMKPDVIFKARLNSSTTNQRSDFKRLFLPEAA